MPDIGAEVAYLFRHAVLRDAAYNMQLPSDRTRLHGLALTLTENLFGGPPPKAELDHWGEQKYAPHSVDAVASELARHAREAGDMPEPRRVYLRRAAEHAAAGQRVEDAARHWLECAELCAGADRAEATRRAAEVLLYSGYAGRAEPLLSASLDLARQSGDGGRQALALASFARACSQTGQVQKAEQAHRDALALHSRAGNRRGEGVALGNLAMLCHQTGRAAQAIELYQRALEIFTAIRDEGLEAPTLGNLAAITHESGRSAEAEAMYARALEILRARGERRVEGMLLGNLAVVYAGTGRIEQAERTYEQALAIHRETGNRRFEAIVLGNLGVRYVDTGRLELARRAFETSIAMLIETGSRLLEGAHRCSYTLCLLALREPTAAREQWRLGSAILREIGDKAELDRRLDQMRQACAKHGVPAFE
jgi:tetratricopeptide (TPR) repeat protein